MKSDVLLHIREAFGVRERTALYLVLGVVEVAGIGVLVAGRLDRIEQVAGLTAVLFTLLISVRWPLIPLFAFAAIIPMEEVVRIGDLATASKALGLLFAVSYALPRIGRLRISAMPKAGYAYIAWAILSVGWALQPSAYFAEIPTLVELFTIAVLVADVVAHRPTIIRPLLWAYSLGAAFTAILGILAYLTGAVASGQRVTAFADQDAGQFALLLLPALIFTLHELTGGRLVVPSVIVGGLTGMAIVMSGTRGSWLGVALVVVVFLLPRLGLLRGMLAVALIAVAIGVSLQLPGVADLVLQRTVLAVPTGGAGRVDIWTVGLQIVESSPVTGVGYANFPIAYTPQLVNQADISSYTDPNFGSHSIVVGTFGELGVVGAICLVLFLGPLLVRRGWGPHAAAVQAILAAMMTAALFIDALNRKQVWLVIGIAAGLAYLRRHAPVPDDAPAPAPGRVVRVSAPPAARGRPRSEPAFRNQLPLGRTRLRTPGRTP